MVETADLGPGAGGEAGVRTRVGDGRSNALVRSCSKSRTEKEGARWWASGPCEGRRRACMGGGREVGGRRRGRGASRVNMRAGNRGGRRARNAARKGYSQSARSKVRRDLLPSTLQNAFSGALPSQLAVTAPLDWAFPRVILHVFWSCFCRQCSSQVAETQETLRTESGPMT